jgi:hypothetical protein
MTVPKDASTAQKSLDHLSCLLLQPASRDSADLLIREALRRELFNLQPEEFEDFLTLAGSHHVIVRALEALLQKSDNTQSNEISERAHSALQSERARIHAALSVLHAICQEFHGLGFTPVVIKSLDHWPDLGSDLDLYADAEPGAILNLMKKRFGAAVAPRSWGDCLANKWNFKVPGIPELVEIHVGRLGQTGEQVALASTLAQRTRKISAGSLEFRVPSIADRILISTLQRMYRHFYFRLCDIVDCVELSEAEGIDYCALRSRAEAADIWEGAATFLAIVSDYAARYRGNGLDLPAFVKASARFGGNAVRFRQGFLRVPILPQSGNLYLLQLGAAVRRLKLRNSARLTLLPMLAAAAVVGRKMTGSDKGIW